MLRRVFCFLALVALAACGVTAEPKWASDDEVARAHFVAGPPASITLYTVISNTNNSGAHAGLLINGSEQIMFDPAGTWYHPRAPERNDVHFGITPTLVDFYIDYHARETYRVREQKIYVTQAVADMVAQRAKAYGAVPKAQCTRAVSTVLKGVPGFESLPVTWFPNKLADSFAKLPGVSERIIRDEDAPDNHGVLLVQTKEFAVEPRPEN